MGYQGSMAIPDPEVSELEAILRRERHARAVARTAARVASERSLPATLDALAHEIQQADSLVAVQVLASETDRDKLHMLGMAGFRGVRGSEFFPLLLECQRRGADLGLLEAFRTGKLVSMPHRYKDVMADPAWEPLHDFHRDPEWDAFASIPITVRGSTVGILNVFVAPGQELDQTGFDFLLAMAEQAGLAIDYASMLERERETAQREERQQLAQDLHDSVVQQLFSLGMLAKTLVVLSETGDTERLPRIRELSAEVEDITGSAMQDLRKLVNRMRPTAVGGVGLTEALTRLSERTHGRTGVKVILHVNGGIGDMEGEFAEDVYHVVSEAVHNAVKHSPADQVKVSLLGDEDGSIELRVVDNGGHPDLCRRTRQDGRRGEGHGLEIMRRRVNRWDGEFSVDFQHEGRGTMVRAVFPHRGPLFGLSAPYPESIR